MLGERLFNIGFYEDDEDNYQPVKVIFDEISTIGFYDKDDNLIMSMQPSDLSILYGALKQMYLEINEEKFLNKKF